jgi:cyclase
MKRIIVLVTIALVGGLSLAASALQAPATPPAPAPAAAPAAPAAKVAEIEKVKDNLYVIKGGGGNTAAFVTEAGVVVVDTKLAGWGQAILDKIKTVTDKPVSTIINTHTHGDHTGSNEFFGASVETVVQDNTKANMEKMEAFQGDKAQFLPKKTYKDKLSLGKGKEKIDLYYFGPGHTNGDTFVVFPALQVMHAGDMFAAKGTPFIDTRNGGSGAAYNKTLARAVAGIKKVETVITGHSPLMTWNDFKEFAAFHKDLFTWVKAQHKAGKTVEEATAAYELPAKYQGYTVRKGQGFGNFQSAVQAMYDDLGPKKVAGGSEK